MLALDDVRAAEIEMDMELGPVEECYAFLQRCGVAVPREEMERVDSLRYTFKNLQSQAVSPPKGSHLLYSTNYCNIESAMNFAHTQ